MYRRRTILWAWTVYLGTLAVKESAPSGVRSATALRFVRQNLDFVDSALRISTNQTHLLRLALRCVAISATRRLVSRPRKDIVMNKEQLLQRITVNSAIFGGKPIIRGMRISVESILGLLAQGESMETILADFPSLQPDDIRACLAYSHAVVAP